LRGWLYDWTCFWRGCFFIVDFFFIFVLKALKVLLLEVAANLRRGWQFVGQLVVGIELSIAFVYFRDDLQIGSYLILGGGVELILDDAQ
jgi:hypothetical protein